MERHVQVTEVSEQPAAQLEDHFLADAAGHGDEQAGRHRLHRDGEGEGGRDAEQRRRVMAVQQRREPGVDGHADQPRAGQRGQALHHDQRHGGVHRAPVRPQQITEQPPAPVAQQRGQAGGDLLGLLRGDPAPARPAALPPRSGAVTRLPPGLGYP